MSNMWKSNWDIFIKLVADMYTQGKSNQEISQEFGDNIVTWKGTVSGIGLDQEYASGIEMHMPEVLINIDKAKFLKVNYAFLLVQDHDKSLWSKIKPGDQVEFKAKIRKGNGPFPGIQVSEVSGDPELTVMLGLEQAVPSNRTKRIGQ